MKEYEISKAGPEQYVAYGITADTAGVGELVSWTTGATFQKASFVLRCTSNFYCSQGSSTSLTIATAFPIPSNMLWRIDVDSPAERYIGIQGVTTAGTAYVKKISDLNSNYGDFAQLCFSADTLVVMPNGFMVPIASVVPGTLLWTPDGEIRVARCHATTTTKLYTLLLGSGVRLDVTESEPFYVRGIKTLARDLKMGDPLDTASGVDTVLAVGWREGQFSVYNLTVEEPRIFYVTAARIRVHNKGV